MLSEIALQEFNSIFKSHFNRELSEEELITLANSVFSFYKQTIKPIKPGEIPQHCPLSKESTSKVKQPTSMKKDGCIKKGVVLCDTKNNLING